MEIKINGSLIGHIYGHNEGSAPTGGTRYRYEYYEVESREVTNGFVTFDAGRGIRCLLSVILLDVDKKKQLKTKSPKS